MRFTCANFILQVMLSDEGQYDELCGPNGCAEQANKFAAIFAVATLLVNGISLPSGLYLDNCGGRVMSGESIQMPRGGSFRRSDRSVFVSGLHMFSSSHSPLSTTIVI
jgi:hypothetical protein